VNLFGQAFAWIFDNWTGSSGVAAELGAHLMLTVISVAIAVVIALPIGLFIGHTGRGRSGAILVSNAARAIPTLGLLSILTLLFGIGLIPPIVVFVILGIPPMLAGAYAGLESVDRGPIDAARAVGMTEWQILFRVEIPLATTLLLGGLRATTLQIIATVSLASFYGHDSLGTFVFNGIATADYVQMVAGAILIAAVALVIDGLLALVQRFAVPRGITRGTVNGKKTTARGTAEGRAAASPLTEGN
jgi:osmoprotectant transport system permease protein